MGSDEQGLRLQELLHRPVGELEELGAAEDLCGPHEQARCLPLRQRRVPGSFERKRVRHRKAVGEQATLVRSSFDPLDDLGDQRQLLRISELQGSERKLDHVHRVRLPRLRGDAAEICEPLLEISSGVERLLAQIEVVGVRIQLRAR